MSSQGPPVLPLQLQAHLEVSGPVKVLKVMGLGPQGTGSDLPQHSKRYWNGKHNPQLKDPTVLLGRWENPWQRVASFLSPESALSTSAGSSKRTRPHLDGPAGQESQIGEDHQQRPGDSREHQGPGPLESMHTETCSALLTQGRTRALHFEVTKFHLMTLKCFLTTFYKSTSSFLSQNSTRNLIRRQ